MRYLASHERAVRGTFDFPIELYYVDPTHPRYEMPFHWHMEHELILVLHGQLHLSVDGQPCDLGPGDCALIADGSIHGGTPEDCIYECVVFDLERFLPGASVCGQRLTRLRETGARLEGRFPAGTQAAELISALFEAMETEKAGYEFTTTGLLWQFLGEMLARHLYRPAEAESPRDIKRTQGIKNALRLIHTQYSEPLSLEGLSRQAGLSPKYFCRVFRQLTGRTPIDYLLYYRVECAAEMLCASQDSITDVAMACGFGDAGYFDRMFRRFKGKTPGEFRRAYGT